MDSAARQLLQVDTVRAESFGQAGLGKLGQLIERVDAPAFEYLGHLFGERERRDIQIVEIWRHRDAGEIASGDDGCVGGFGNGNIDIVTRLLRDSLGNLLRRAVKPPSDHPRGRRRYRARSARTKVKKRRRFQAGRPNGP